MSFILPIAMGCGSRGRHGSLVIERFLVLFQPHPIFLMRMGHSICLVFARSEADYNEDLKKLAGAITDL